MPNPYNIHHYQQSSALNVTALLPATTLACNPCQAQPCKSSALHKRCSVGEATDSRSMIGRRGETNSADAYKAQLSFGWARPLCHRFNVRPQPTGCNKILNKMRTRIFRVSSLSRSRKQDTNNDQVHCSDKTNKPVIFLFAKFLIIQSIFKISRAIQLSKTTSHQRHRILVPQNSVSKRIERQKCEATKCTPAYNTRSNRCKLILFY